MTRRFMETSSSSEEVRAFSFVGTGEVADDDVVQARSFERAWGRRLDSLMSRLSI